MENKAAEQYNSHAKLLADIALRILKGNKEVLDVNGIKEIVALYLLIPYITPQTLATPGSEYKTPHLEGGFDENITLEDLRNSICHSFVTVEENKNDGTYHGKVLFFDDRVHISAKEHSKLGEHSSAYIVPIEYVHKRLVEHFEEVQKYK